MKEGEFYGKQPTDAADGMFCAPAPNTEARTVCGAKTRSGGLCQKSPVPGRDRCRLHNGNAKRGTDHPNFRSGLYSKTISRDLRAEYQRLLAHPGLLSARSDIALLRVRLNQLAGRLESGESSRRWNEVREALSEYQAATGAGDDPRASAALARFGTLVNGAGDQEGAWLDFAALIERVSTIAAREHRMLIEEKLTVRPEDVRVIVASITQAVFTYVPDPVAQAKIAERVAALRVLTKDELGALVARALDPTTVTSETGEP